MKRCRGKRRSGAAVVLGEWAGLACERMIRCHSRSRLPLIVPGHGPEGGKWAKIEAKCSMSPIQCSAQGCCVGCTVYMAEAWERRAVQGFGTATKHSSEYICCIITEPGDNYDLATCNNGKRRIMR